MVEINIEQLEYAICECGHIALPCDYMVYQYVGLPNGGITCGFKLYYLCVACYTNSCFGRINCGNDDLEAIRDLLHTLGFSECDIPF